jgi:hypothetical protein
MQPSRFCASQTRIAPPCRAYRDNPWLGFADGVVKRCGNPRSNVVGYSRRTRSLGARRYGALRSGNCPRRSQRRTARRHIGEKWRHQSGPFARRTDTINQSTGMSGIHVLQVKVIQPVTACVQSPSLTLWVVFS